MNRSVRCGYAKGPRTEPAGQICTIVPDAFGQAVAVARASRTAAPYAGKALVVGKVPNLLSRRLLGGPDPERKRHGPSSSSDTDSCSSSGSARRSAGFLIAPSASGSVQYA
jgi:hypothetical protein